MKKLLFVATLAAALTLAGCSMPKLGAKGMNKDEAKQKAVEFINANLVQPGTQVQVDEITEEGDLYKVLVKLSSGQSVTSYISKDGTKFFPQVMDIKEVESKNQGAKDREQAADQQPSAEISNKTDKPKVEVFVMSYCPYGTQIEKGILPVAELLGKKIDFSIKFCDYAMHGEKELDENSRQVCIAQEEGGKFNTYLKCFLQDSKANECMLASKIDTKKIESCMSALDKKFKIKEKNSNKDTWDSGSYPPYDVNKADNQKYGVKGSPTLIINGEQAESGRDSASLLKVVCSAFKNQPEECKKELSSDTPAPGFGTGTGASSSGGCAN